MQEGLSGSLLSYLGLCISSGLVVRIVIVEIENFAV